MIWFTSDFHIGHDKDFIVQKRGFDTVDEMNVTIINNLFKCLDEGDDLYILGDIAMGTIEAAAPYLKMIPWQTHFLIGNHDSLKRINLYESLGWINEGYATMIQDGKWNFYLSHYPTLVANYDDGKKHLPVINLYGHTHQNSNFFNDNPYMYHVGVDSHNCMPINIDQIKMHIRKKVEKEIING